MEWWVWVIIVIIAIMAYPLVRAIWWRKVSSTWEERRDGRMDLWAKRTDDLSQYIRNQEAAGKDIRTMPVLKIEGDLHSLAEAQRSDLPPTPDQAVLQDATVRFFELGRDIIRATREGREDDANRLVEESEKLADFVHLIEPRKETQEGPQGVLTVCPNWNCGRANDPEAKFCAFCGTSLEPIP